MVYTYLYLHYDNNQICATTQTAVNVKFVSAGSDVFCFSSFIGSVGAGGGTAPIFTIKK